MKLRNIIFSSLIAAVAFILTGCEEEAIKAKEGVVNFTVRYSDVSYDYAIINVKHDGPEDITWYGFLTEDVSTQDFTLMNKEWTRLLTSGKAIEVKRDQERNILLENLKENTSYKYIVFGLKADGGLYDNVGLGSIKFTADEMSHAAKELSGGQKAKLFFAKMALGDFNVLVLDEPTRNLSPLSNPMIREVLKNFGGVIISVSHDRKYISEVCEKILKLDENGLKRVFPEF